MVEGREIPQRETPPSFLMRLRSGISYRLRAIFDRKLSQPVDTTLPYMEPEPQRTIPSPAGFRLQALQTLQNIGESTTHANIRKAEYALRMRAIIQAVDQTPLRDREDVKYLYQEYLYFQREKKRLEQFPDIKRAAEPVPNFTSYQHSTYRPLGDGILASGFQCTSEAGLSDTTHKLTSNYEANLYRFIRRWRASNYHQLVLIRLPRLEPVDQAILDELKSRGSDPTDLIFLEVQSGQKAKIKSNDVADLDSYIPVRYVEGYIDFDTNEFVQNPSFNPIIPEQSYKKIVDRLRKIKAKKDKLKLVVYK